MSYTFTLAPGALETELKRLILQETDKLDDFAPEAIGDDEPLFGDSSRVALDSLDALQISVALQTHFQVRLQGDREVRRHMLNVRDLAAFVRASHSA
ncbi:MAG TPA: acyl carrier protein [Neisseria sp.]|jgi:acyl carrier protein|uniref:Acyl carrier protein n=1 Tax=Uruburuella suis TaxID=252130 RepID=A0AAE9GSD8_9NEIS|nr:acyl carrier protein [Uruburuella suis]MBP8025043.1 acyl carrier protein [Neisseria sp.]TCP02714.1 acyl carrier protein [Uruburuella suis]UOO79115.1 acyl carrier protein [Uruburuella suis]HRM22262.1 acyl carrier protein [Neisseria sp.]